MNLESRPRMSGCIYCGGEGPFTAEHVIPAGLGGDDKAWMLTGCVCGTCNSVRFSALESHLLKHSHIALARLFMQRSTRERGVAPSFQSRSTYYRDPTSKLLLVAEIKAQGEPEVLPQIVFDAQVGSVGITGTAGPALEEFLARAPWLGESLEIIKKNGPKSFSCGTARWKDGAFEILNWVSVKKPPENGIWFEELSSLYTPSVAETPPPSIHRRAKGQTVCRAEDIDAALELLLLARKHFAELRLKSETANPQTDTRPTIHMNMKVETDKVRRAITKIGLNLVAFIGGPELVRETEFDAAVEYVLVGSGDPNGTLAKDNQFGPMLPDRHIFMLFNSHIDGVASGLMLLASLYGGLPEIYRLAMFETGHALPLFEEPKVIHVDYNANKVELLDIVGHALKVAGGSGV